jgi:hypothetical protein
MVYKDNGWIKLHRKVQENEFYPKGREFTRFEAWIDLLLNANHKDGKMKIGSKIIVKRGEQLRSLETLSKKWSWSKARVKRTLLLFQKHEMIEKIATQQSTQLPTRITICNYDKYQDERHSDRHSSVTRTRRRINSSIRKKHIKNPNLDEVKEFFKEKGFKEEIAIRAWSGYDAAGWIDTNGKPVRNWKQKMINVWFTEENRSTTQKIKITTLPDDAR